MFLLCFFCFALFLSLFSRPLLPLLTPAAADFFAPFPSVSHNQFFFFCIECARPSSLLLLPSAARPTARMPAAFPDPLRSPHAPLTPFPIPAALSLSFVRPPLVRPSTPTKSVLPAAAAAAARRAARAAIHLYSKRISSTDNLQTVKIQIQIKMRLTNTRDLLASAQRSMLTRSRSITCARTRARASCRIGHAHTIACASS